MKCLAAIIWSSLFLLSSCTSHTVVDKKKFDRVEIGMTLHEVKYILGEPDEIIPISGSQTNYCYLTKNNVITKKYAVVAFDESGRVSYVAFENPE